MHQHKQPLLKSLDSLHIFEHALISPWKALAVLHITPSTADEFLLQLLLRQHLSEQPSLVIFFKRVAGIFEEVLAVHHLGMVVAQILQL